MSDEEPPPKKCKVCSQLVTRPPPNYGFCTEGCRNEKKNTKSYVKISDRPGACCLFMHDLSCLYTKSDTQEQRARVQQLFVIPTSAPAHRHPQLAHLAVKVGLEARKWKWVTRRMWCCAAGGTAHRRNGYRWVAAVASHPAALNLRVHLNALVQSGRLDSGSACSATATKAAKPLAATHTLVITSQAHTPNLLQMQPPPQTRRKTKQGHPCCNTFDL